MKEERPFPHCSSAQNQPVTRATLKWPILKKENKKKRRDGKAGRGERETLLPCIFYNQEAASQKEQKPQLQKQNTHN